MLNNLNILMIVFFISLILSIIIIFWHSKSNVKSTRRDDIAAVQASHIKPVARIGGLSIMIALIFAIVPFWENSDNLLKYSFLILSACPVFIVGLREDLGYFSSPRIRLLAAGFSGFVFVILFGIWLTRTDIPGLDFALHWAPLGICFSIFLAAGVKHAFNLIDGLNGLACFTSIGAALSLAMISHQVGLDEYSYVLIILTSAIVGLLVLNFPFGKIFLGDGGAYAIGHILVWMAISILYAAPSISPLAILLIFFYPVAETLLTIARRMYLGAPISHPDRMHFHQLVMRCIEIVVLGRKMRHIANPLATLLVLPFAFTPMLIGVFLAMDSNTAMIALILFSAIFFISYKAFVWFALRFQRSANFKT